MSLGMDWLEVYREHLAQAGRCAKESEELKRSFSRVVLALPRAPKRKKLLFNGILSVRPIIILNCTPYQVYDQLQPEVGSLAGPIRLAAKLNT